jgi:hypothetical protein
MRNAAIAAGLLAFALIAVGCANETEETTEDSGLAGKVLRPEDVEVPENPDNSLSGTTWAFDEYTVTFEDQPLAHVKGGKVDEVDPAGVQAVYVLEDSGRIEIGALGESRTGLWDGEDLVIDGISGKQLETAAP